MDPFAPDNGQPQAEAKAADGSIYSVGRRIKKMMIVVWKKLFCYS
jgi:hypothetical protein